MKRYFAVLTMALALAACNKQDPFAGETLTAHIGGPQSKVEFNSSSGKFAWSDPDNIALYTSAGAFKTVSVSASGVFTFLPEGGETRDGYAFYPVEAAAGTPAAPQVTLPASYDIDAEGMGDWYPTPMIAVNDPASDDLWFYHLGGALRLTLNSVPAGTVTISVTTGKGITGTFDVADPDSATPTIAPADAIDALSFVFASGLEEDTDGIIVNVPLPTGTYPRVTVEARGEGDALLASVSDYKDWVFPRARARQATFDFATSHVVEAHPFSVADGRTVTFSPGNLQNDNGWGFASAQYEFTEADLLSWSDSWPGLDAGWRLLSASEWEYLLGKFDYLPDGLSPGDNTIVGPVTDFGRNGGNPHALRAYATIYTADAEIIGLLLLPDDWAGAPAGCREVVCGRWEASWDAAKDNTYNAGGSAGTSGEWAAMEAAGAIFLPAAGINAGSYMQGLGAYWSSTIVEGTTECRTCLFAEGVHVFTNVTETNRCSFRLVKDN